MGLEDRDYYRENYAKKNGMRYNARNATYSSDSDSQGQRFSPRVVGADWHWSLKFALWLFIALLVMLIVKFVNSHA